MYMFYSVTIYMSRFRLVRHEFGPCRHPEEEAARDKAAGWAPAWAPGPCRLEVRGPEMHFGWLPDVVQEVRLLGLRDFEGRKR